MTPVELLLAKLPDAKKTGKGWSARCPAHDDRKASLSIGTGDDGRTLLHCHAGCATEDIVARLGLTMADLMPSGSNRPRRQRQIAKAYDYRDENGRLLFQTCRTQPKGFFQRQPKLDGGWQNNLTGVRRAPYLLPTLLAANPQVVVFVVEGEKDADRLAASGLVATCNAGGAGKWRDSYNKYFKDRIVVILPDNDTPGQAHAKKVASALANTAATVKVLELPNLPTNGDVSEWLDADGTIEGLAELARNAPEWCPESQDDHRRHLTPYSATPGGIVWYKPTAQGPVAMPVTNFTARIVADITEDDGAETRRQFEVEAKLRRRAATFHVPTSQFSGMNWAIEHLGAEAIVYPGFGLKDHARAAVQLLSNHVIRRTIYTHMGWRKISGRWSYLHAGGAIGPEGPVAHIETAPGERLRLFGLPEPPVGERLVQAVKASLRLLKITRPAIMVPVLAATYRAPLGACDFAVALTGPTGAGKTELAALAQQHYGPGLDARNLPANWASTGNALEVIAFAAKDVLLVVDDFAPSGSMYDVQRYHRDADRLLRGQGNLAGRQRLRSDSSLRPTKWPRGLIISTGEDVPRGQSLRARMLVVELGPSEINWGAVTCSQEGAVEGLLARAMAGYVQYLASRYDEVRQSLPKQLAALRGEATRAGMHRRIPAIVASLALGLRYFIDYALDVGAIQDDEAKGLWRRGWRALGEIASEQEQHHRAAEPVSQFVKLLGSALSSGRAHLAAPYGVEPKNPSACGWRQRTVGTGQHERDEWVPCGERVGWADGENIYLDPSASYAAVQKLARDQGDALTVGERTLHRRMKEKGLLLTMEPGRLTTRRQLGGKRQHALHLASGLLVGEAGRVGQNPETLGDFGTSFGPTSDGATPELGHEMGHDTRPGGPNGPVGPLVGDTGDWGEV